MAAPARKIETGLDLAALARADAPVGPRAGPRPADDLSAPAPSPALALRQELNARMRDELMAEPTIEKWSARRSMAFVIGASALLWAGIAGLFYIL